MTLLGSLLSTFVMIVVMGIFVGFVVICDMTRASDEKARRQAVRKDGRPSGGFSKSH